MQTIRIYAKKYERKDGGKAFFGYSLFREDKNIPYTQVKCTMDCGNLPIKEQGYYLVDVTKSSIQGEVARITDLGPVYRNTLWVHEFENCRRDKAFEEYVAQKKEEETQAFLKQVGIN